MFYFTPPFFKLLTWNNFKNFNVKKRNIPLSLLTLWNSLFSIWRQKSAAVGQSAGPTTTVIALRDSEGSVLATDKEKVLTYPLFLETEILSKIANEKTIAVKND